MKLNYRSLLIFSISVPVWRGFLRAILLLLQLRTRGRQRSSRARKIRERLSARKIREWVSTSSSFHLIAICSAYLSRRDEGAFRFAGNSESAARRCWTMALPGRITATTSKGDWKLGPYRRECKYVCVSVWTCRSRLKLHCNQLTTGMQLRCDAPSQAIVTDLVCKRCRRSSAAPQKKRVLACFNEIVVLLLILFFLVFLLFV